MLAFRVGEYVLKKNPFKWKLHLSEQNSILFLHILKCVELDITTIQVAN
jgi:hypothetical protein